jgi:antitoxin HigA-1
MAPHPGAVLKQLMQEQGVKPKRLSIETGVEDSTIYRLLKGQVSVSVGMAFKLASATHTEPRYWLDLQTSHNIDQWDESEQWKKAKEKW